MLCGNNFTLFFEPFLEIFDGENLCCANENATAISNFFRFRCIGASYAALPF